MAVSIFSIRFLGDRTQVPTVPQEARSQMVCDFRDMSSQIPVLPPSSLQRCYLSIRHMKTHHPSPGPAKQPLGAGYAAIKLPLCIYQAVLPRPSPTGSSLPPGCERQDICHFLYGGLYDLMPSVLQPGIPNSFYKYQAGKQVGLAATQP